MELIKSFLNELASGLLEEIKEAIHVTKDDGIAIAGGSTTGGIWGYTQNEIAGLMTIIIGGAIVLHKLVLICITVHRHFVEVKKIQKEDS